MTGPVTGAVTTLAERATGADARAVVGAVRRTTARRTGGVVALLAVAVAGVFLAGLLLGSYTVTLPDLVRIVLGAEIPGATFVVMEDELPRAVVGTLAGLALGLSGGIVTTVLRNPLASPDVIGVTAGASAGAVVSLVVLGLPGPAVPACALIGTLLVAVLVHGLSRGGPAGGSRLVLVGIGVAAVLQAVVAHLLARSDVRVAADAFRWLNGSLNASTWPTARDLLLALVVLVPAGALLSRVLGGLALGDDPAAGLGIRLGPARALLLLTGVALAAVATAAAGPVAFVAFVSAPVARRLLRGRLSLTAAALVGALVVLAADLVGHGLVPGVALPVGVVTGALGAPVLLVLLVSSRRSR